MCYARLASVGRLVLLRNVYLHAVRHYTAAGKRFIYNLSSIIYKYKIYNKAKPPNLQYKTLFYLSPLTKSGNLSSIFTGFPCSRKQCLLLAVQTTVSPTFIT